MMLLSILKKHFIGFILTFYFYGGLIYVKCNYSETIFQDIAIFCALGSITVIVIAFLATVVQDYVHMKEGIVNENV